MPQSSITQTISTLQEKFPHASFIALGQTVFWDEPVKAAWRLILDRFWPTATMLAGVHDTDYFAKITGLVRDDVEFVAIAHDDGKMKGMWSAAGELSALFGSEDVPTRAMYKRAGIPFDTLASAFPGGKQKMVEETTSTWGWRGLVQTKASTQIARDVSLSSIRPALMALLDWGMSQTLQSLTQEAKSRCTAVMDALKKDVDTFCTASGPGASLTDLYKFLLPKFYELLMGRSAEGLTITSSSDHFRFNLQSCNLPRFAIVGTFLDPSMRDIAVRAYDSAVAGGGMYGLSTFGPGALPFDVVAPGRGRGTLRVEERRLSVDFAPTGFTVECERDLSSPHALASVLQQHLGEGVVLVGKAVSLIDMISAEHVIVFHETASEYTDRTAQMNQRLREAGVKLNLYPIVRLSYPTWDSVGSAPSDLSFLLPKHLARSFGKGMIHAREFAATWRDVVTRQQELIAQLSSIGKPDELFDLLAQHDQSRCWSCFKDDYHAAAGVLRQSTAIVRQFKQQIIALKSEAQDLKQERASIERAMSADFRATVLPLHNRLQRQIDIDEPLLRQIEHEDERRRVIFTERIEDCRHRRRDIEVQVRKLRTRVRSVERGQDAQNAREARQGLIFQAQMGTLELVREAFLAAQGLLHTNARPSAWWLTAVDPERNWFTAMVDGAQARLEEI